MQKLEAVTSGGKVEVELNGDMLSITINGELYRTVSFDGPGTITNTYHAKKETV
ncbi:hypothetical protein [Tumebacillus flagellatus]|uniref:hypothetical protein n=1 Tax=Tumebacillus flagellatus TaxID=1157490 RepID=UPI0013772BF0|nr:hypothetical protein [Tumebacillus flagellatus]